MRFCWLGFSRVGIYGYSAGGQNALGALLFHGDFYKAAVALAGCHDNRVDNLGGAYIDRRILDFFHRSFKGSVPEKSSCTEVGTGH